MTNKYLPEIGWVLIYISAFGFSDYIISSYCITDSSRFLYYLILLVIGFFYKKNI